MRPVMARRNVEMMKEADDAITCGTDNEFANLGDADADERQTKLRLAHAINGVIARRRLSQAAAAEKPGISQPKVSASANYKLDCLSVERLMTFLTAQAGRLPRGAADDVSDWTRPGDRDQEQAAVADSGTDFGCSCPI